MTALAHEITVPAYPLGQPIDGRPRYGMTPEMARTYRWLVANRPHGEAFKPRCREIAAGTDRHVNKVHAALAGLVERGWLEAILCASEHRATKYAFVHPVKTFKAPRHA